VGFSSWILAFHLISAFAVASSLVLYSVLVFSGRRMTTLDETRALFRVAPIGTGLVLAGTGLVLVFGVILALDSDAFNIWDPWVIAAIVLWAAMGRVGQLTGAYYSAAEDVAKGAGPGAEADVLARLRASKGANLHLATVAIFLLILLDMIFKPGA
jgi:hypothetical protein